MTELYGPLFDGPIALEPLEEGHRECLRAACAEDAEIWTIYPFSYAGEHFDPAFDRMLTAGSLRLGYAIVQNGKVVGMTAWIDNNPANGSVEIGNSYIVPSLRGSGFNTRLKRLMIDHAVALGYRRIVFKVDEINKRSQAAVLKLGCTKEGVLRAERITWTGRVRDTGIFSILAEEWQARGQEA
jgi:RimJ/RimL family protein N-acetyltransferase